MPKRVIVAIVAVIAVIWIALFVWLSDQELHVVEAHRVINENSDIDNRDCLVTAKAKDGVPVRGYAEASACTYLQMGDVVKIEDGFVKQ